MTVHGRILGAVGIGRTRRQVAERARGFSKRVLYLAHYRHPDAECALGAVYSGGLGPLLSEAGFVTLHVRLTPNIHHLIGEANLAAMKSTAPPDQHLSQERRRSGGAAKVALLAARNVVAACAY